MSERITAANLDEVIKRNEVIEEQMKQSASLIWSKYNPMQINSPIQLALQILRPYGLIQLPIDNHYLSGAIFVRDGKRIPLINTALPRANQYFTAWHEIYHLLFDEVSFDHLIESEILMEERKAEYFAALMLLGNLMPYFEGLKDMEFQAKAFQCMNAFQAPYKAVLISLYESAVKNGNTAIAEEVKENFDVQVEDIAQRFRDLGLDDSLVRPSYVVNVSPLQEKINKTIRNEPEVEYHKDNADDYYGKEGFKAVHEYLVNGGKSCMAGFVLKNTLSDNGGVTRGICKMDEQNNLTEVVETKNIVKTADGAEADGVAVDVNSLVSMNMWGLTPDFLDVLEKGFKEFFEKEVPGNPLKAEYLIPIFIGELLEQGKMNVKVLKTNDTWYGMTYHEDVAAVRESFKEMLENGVYKADLFGDL